MKLARWLRALATVLVGLLALGAVLAAVATVRGILTQGDVIYTDAILLYQALRSRDGLAVYTAVTRPPFLVMIYWPLVPWVAGAAARVADLDAAGTLYLLRSLSAVAALVTSASIAGLATLCGARRRSALVAAGLFLTANVVHPWAYAARADLPALAFVLTGVWLALSRQTLGSAALAGTLMAAGFVSKQTYAVGVVAICLMLFWRRDLVRLTALAAAWCAIVGSVALVMTLQTEGRFLEQTVTSNVLPFRLDRLLDRLLVYTVVSLPILSLAAIGWRNGRTAPRRVLWLYLGLATLAGVVSVGRIGSYFNYLLETTALLCVFAGVGFERCLETARRLAGSASGDAARPTAGLALRAAARPMLALLIAVCTLLGPVSVLVVRSAAAQPDGDALVEILRDAKGLVLTERDATAVMLAGKEPIAADPIQLAVMTGAGRLDVGPLNELVRQRSFALIALRCRVEDVPIFDEFAWWPTGTREVIKERYRFSGFAQGFALYVPGGDIAITEPAPEADDRPRDGGKCRDARS